jgi:tripartite-type tricarboxylate transporter receptor subunit TctC
MNKRIHLRALLVLAAFWALPAAAQTYPAKPIRVITSLPAGSSIDITVRFVSERFQQITGQPFVIDNRTGASGVIAADLGAKAAPDGYTLLAGNISQFSINPFTFKQLPYDPAKDFAAVTQLVRTTYFWIAGPAAPGAALKDYLAWAKSNPGKATYASGGVGSISHFATVMIALAAGADLTHIPYKGSAQHVADLTAGRVGAAFSPWVSVREYVKSGQLRVLAVASEQRSSVLPDVPTFVELGYPDVVAPLWSGLMAPAGTPPTIVDAVARGVAQSFTHSEVRDKMLAIDQEPVGNTPAEFARFLEQDRARWGKAIKASGFKPGQ